MNTNKSAEVPERLGCGHSKRRPSGTTQPAGEPRAAGLERPGNGPRYLVRKDHRGACGGRVMAYKSAVVRCRCVSCANGRAIDWRRSPWLISSLKPYWGKPAVRNFRGGGGNMPASPVRPPRRLMDIGLYPASDSAMRLPPTRHLLQGQLFPILSEELGPMGEHHEAFVRALALLQLDGVVTRRQGRGRPAHDRANIARAFLAKAIFNIPHTRALLDRLAHDPTLRRLCGWERAADVPDESVFSRAFSEFARTEFAQQVHAALIQRTQGERLVGHILRDATAIEGREKPAPKPPAAAPAARRLHRKSGAAKRPEQRTRIERQSSGT